MGLDGVAVALGTYYRDLELAQQVRKSGRTDDQWRRIAAYGRGSEASSVTALTK